MSEQIRKALAAAADAGGDETVRRLLEQCGLSVCGFARSGAQALEMVERMCPDVLLADLILPGTDGLGLARRIWSSVLPVYPGVVVAHYGDLPGSEAEYLARMGGAAVEKPVSGEALRAAIRQILPENRAVPESRVRRLDEMLDLLNVFCRPGRDYLRYAILLAHMDRRLTGRLTAGLYPMTGARFGKSARHTEQAMRHAIDEAWRGEAADAQYEFFQGTIDAQRGKPTCGEMIAQLADILRLEG